MKKLKEIVDVLSQIVALKDTAKDGGPGSGQKGHTTNQEIKGPNIGRATEGTKYCATHKCGHTYNHEGYKKLFGVGEEQFKGMKPTLEKDDCPHCKSKSK